ncbi:MAG TPA: four helix bundle protein [Pyrinomonadaceae bacterium]|nr:four helix bundle protein [Pyrinomonadaceae bacterium]
MSRIEKFEDLEVWKLSRSLANAIYNESSVGDFARDFALRDQIRKASISVVSNIAEGFERDGDKEFIQFLYTAKGSCDEVRAQLYLAFDRTYISEEQLSALNRQATEVSRMISGLIKYLRQSQVTGKKYKPTAQSLRPN